MTIEYEVFKTKRAGFIGRKPIGRLHLAEWMQSIDDRVKRLESALNNSGKNEPNRNKTLVGK